MQLRALSTVAAPTVRRQAAAAPACCSPEKPVADSVQLGVSARATSSRTLLGQSAAVLRGVLTGRFR